MKIIKNILTFIVFVCFGMPIFILFSPIMLVILPIQFFQRKRFEKKYKAFLNMNNGMNFFCYNSRKKSKNYIEKTIIPNLPETIEIVYLNGKNIETDQNPEFISEALYKLKNYIRFPHLMKIRNGKLIDQSINNPFFNVLNLTMDKGAFLSKINQFFELKEIKNVS